MSKNERRRLAGVLPIVHTPFLDDESIDLPTLRREVDWAYAQGVDGMGTGMVSEILRLTFDERIALTHALAEANAGRGAIFMAVGAESGKQAERYAREAERAGFDAVMAVPPTASRIAESHLVDYFRRLADAIAIPVIVQDASGYVGQAIPLSACVALLDRYGPEKVLFKPEAAPIGPNLSALRDATGGRARIFEGSGGILLVDSHRRGIAGTMPGMELVDGIVALWRALERGDDDTAYRIHFPISAIVALQMQAGLDGFLTLEKHFLVRRGVFANTLRRRPYSWELDAETTAEAERLFDRMLRELARE